MSILVSCKNVTKKYGRKTALNQLNLELESGKIIGLLGPNGSGKTTLIKTINNLLVPTSGEILINGEKPGTKSKAIISYLPERTYLNSWMKVNDLLDYFDDFYNDFDKSTALSMLESLHIQPEASLKTLSKGTKEKVQLILVMSRRASLYILDEPIAGVDPAARDYILSTILNNYNPEASILLSTHLISDIENILDDIIFIKDGQLLLHEASDTLREEKGKSIDALFREVFSCLEN